MQTHKKQTQIGLSNRLEHQVPKTSRKINPAAKAKQNGLTGMSSHTFAQLPVYANTVPATPLRVNQAGDLHEREAQQVSEQKGHSAGQQATTRTGNQPHGPVAHPAIQEAIRTTQHLGKPLAQNDLEHVQEQLGHDFSQIRVHADERSTAMNEALHANAFTVGQSIYFDQSTYAPGTAEGQRLLAHELTHTVQQGNGQPSIQREEKKKGEPEKPEIDFHLLPPDVKLKFHHLVFAADTDKVQLDYSLQSLRLSLGYKYGSALSLGMRTGDTSASLGWTPGGNQLNLGLSRPGMSGSLGYDPTKQKLSLGLHYGDKLLPSPDVMGQKFQAGGEAVGRVLGGIPGAFNDPFQFYRDHKEDIGSISESVDLVKKVTDYGKKKVRFGADLGLSWDPVSKLVIGGRVGVMF